MNSRPDEAEERRVPPVSAYRLSHSAAPWTKAKVPSNHHGVGRDTDRDIDTQTEPSRKRTRPKKK